MKKVLKKKSKQKASRRSSKKKISKKKSVKLKKLVVKKSSHKKSEEIKHFRTGIKGFDVLLDKGIPTGTAVLVEGGPGSGKTLFCLQTGYNACKAGKKVLYMTFEEPPRRLMGHMKNFGWNPEKYVKSGHLLIRRFNALDVARSVEALLSEAKKELLIDIQPVLIPEDYKPDLVIIDSLSSIASAFSGEESRFRIYMEQLFRYLETHNITSLLIRETSNPTHLGNVYTQGGEAVSFLADGIIVIYNVVHYNGQRGRAVEILKMRGEDIDRRIVMAEIKNKKGYVINSKKTLKMKHMKGSYKLT